MRDRGWLVGFVVLSAIWGASFALIKVGVDSGVPPVWVALWRCGFGAMTLLASCAVLRARLPRDPASWGHAAVVAALLNAVPFTLLAVGERQVTSVLAGVINATTPLMTLLVGLGLVPQERVSWRRLAGLAVGFAGVACLLQVWRVGLDGSVWASGTLGGALACLGSTLCYGAGFSYTRRWYAGRAGSVVALAAAQVCCASLELALVAPWLGGSPTWPGVGPAAALTVLGAMGTGYAYILNLRVVRTAGAGVASTVTYLTPVWSTLIGALLLAEPVGWPTVLGALLVVAGVLTTHTSTAAPRRKASVRPGTLTPDRRLPRRQPSP